jgi:hypothetical protein
MRYLIPNPEMFICNKFCPFMVMFFYMLQVSIHHAETHSWEGHKDGKILPQFYPT